MLIRRFGDNAVGEPPEIDEYCAFWLRTYQLLSPSRPEGQSSVQPIPLTEMAALAQIINLPCDPEEYVMVMREIDLAFVDHYNSKRKAAEKKDGIRKQARNKR